MRKIQDTVRQNYGTKYRVELFGSTSYGVDSPTSDLDLVIVVRTYFHLHSPVSPNLNQDLNRVDGFPPSLNLASLPRKRIPLPLICRRLKCRLIRKLYTTSGPSQPEHCVPQMIEAPIAGT